MQSQYVRCEPRADVYQTARGAILIFLLLQLTYNSLSKVERIGAPNPFTQYLKFLPSSFSLPTFWNAAERELIAGTSLEPALHAKLKSLDREFAALRELTASIGWCQDHWWSADIAQGVSINDWRLVDAMYRSRALDLPGTGHVMVPCIDMVNHASGDNTSAMYDTDSNGDATLILREGKCIGPGEEASLTYGDEKGACEMLFSYGFIEDTMETARELFLDLDIPDDDPLKPVKKALSNSSPGFRLFSQADSSTNWEGPFVWLLCINEEDGLHFQLSQTIDGERELKVYWDDFEISDVSTFGQILEAHALWDIFRLRMVTVLQERVASQLLSLESSKTRLGDIQRSSYEHVGANVSRYALRLRFLEETLLLRAYRDFDDQVRVPTSSAAVAKNDIIMI